MVNKVILVGNVGIDPEVRTTESGVKVARVRLATTERLFDRASNETKEHTEWHTITLWRGLADVVDRYVRKGTQLYIEGRLRTREWMDKDNNKRYTTEILADTLHLLGRRPGHPAPAATASAGAHGPHGPRAGHPRLCGQCLVGWLRLAGRAVGIRIVGSVLLWTPGRTGRLPAARLPGRLSAAGGRAATRSPGHAGGRSGRSALLTVPATRVAECGFGPMKKDASVPCGTEASFFYLSPFTFHLLLFTFSLIFSRSHSHCGISRQRRTSRA